MFQSLWTKASAEQIDVNEVHVYRKDFLISFVNIIKVMPVSAKYYTLKMQMINSTSWTPVGNTRCRGDTKELGLGHVYSLVHISMHLYKYIGRETKLSLIKMLWHLDHSNADSQIFQVVGNVWANIRGDYVPFLTGLCSF